MLDEELHGNKEDESTGDKDKEELGSVRRRRQAVTRGMIWVAAGRKRRNQAAVVVMSSWVMVLKRKRNQKRQ